jgi:hypothetical protein
LLGARFRGLIRDGQAPLAGQPAKGMREPDGDVKNQNGGDHSGGLLSAVIHLDHLEPSGRAG